jgi:hypothetical protein
MSLAGSREERDRGRREIEAEIGGERERQRGGRGGEKEGSGRFFLTAPFPSNIL